jgi:hypothetical protein
MFSCFGVSRGILGKHGREIDRMNSNRNDKLTILLSGIVVVVVPLLVLAYVLGLGSHTHSYVVRFWISGSCRKLRKAQF